MSPADVIEHRWLGKWLRTGSWRGGCSCGERFTSLFPTGLAEAFEAHVAEVTETEEAAQ